MADNDLPRIPHPAELFTSDPVDVALVQQAAESPAQQQPPILPPFPTALGSLEGTRLAYEWAQFIVAFHGVMAPTFIQGRMLDAANTMDAEKYLGWQAIGAALWEMTRNSTDDDVVH